MKNRRWKNLCAVVVPALLLAMPLALSSCGDNEALASGVAVNVTLQETTATISVNWTYRGSTDGWTMADEWRSSRVSGGDNWNVTGVSPNRSASFTVPRASASDAVGQFCVIPVRVNPEPGRFSEVCANFNVPRQVPPPIGDVEIDSITIVVTDASTGQPIRFEDNARVEYREVIEGGVIDTIWDYKVMYEGQEFYTVHATGRSSTDHGIQLTALAYKDGAVVGCNGDCRAFPPELHWEGCVAGVDCPENVGMPWREPDLRQAYNPFPPAVDVLGR